MIGLVNDLKRAFVPSDLLTPLFGYLITPEIVRHGKDNKVQKLIFELKFRG